MPPPEAPAARASAAREARPAPGDRLPYIDGLRGLAVLMVLVYHCWVHTIRAPILVAVGRYRVDVTAPLHYGYLGVNLFLLLSGFCLTYPLVREGKIGVRLDPARFFRRRAWRILPPYYVALTAFSLLPLFERAVRQAVGRPVDAVPAVTMGQVIAHVFMAHNFSLAWMGAINASFWSLALECQLYLVFPLLVWGFARWGRPQMLLLVLALTLGYRTWVYLAHDTTRLEVGYIYAYAVPGRLFEFALGMAAALTLGPGGPSPDGQPCGISPRRYLWGSAILGVVGVAVAHRWSPFAPITDILWGLTFFCLVMGAGGQSARGGGWLDSRPLVALGAISYSVYLLHEPLVRRGYEALQGLHLAPWATLLLFELGIAPLLVSLGWLFFVTVEARFLRAGKAVERQAAP